MAVSGEGASDSSRAPKCPQCGGKTDVQKAKSGPNSGQFFWGCTRFPKCRGLVTFNESSDLTEPATPKSAVSSTDQQGTLERYVLDEFVHMSRKGFGKVKQVRDEEVEVEFFHSSGPDGRFVEWIPENRITGRKPPEGQNCRYRLESRWHAGRILSVAGNRVSVRPTGELRAIQLSPRDVFILALGHLPNPIDSISDGVLESPLQAVARAEWTEILCKLRGACRGMAGLASSRIALHRHQAEIASRVLRDPVQRYLLADEVGLGKTIEAGIVLRQFLLDDPDATACVIAPEALLDQWQCELREKFGVGDFGANRVRLWSHDSNTWDLDQTGLCIVDEAHHLASGAMDDESPTSPHYQALRNLTGKSERLLLLSATPLLHNEEAFLGMLHLIDPTLYPLSDIEGFKLRIDQKKEFAFRFQAFEPSAADYVLEEHAEAFVALLPHDGTLEQLTTQLNQRIGSGDSEGPEFDTLVRRIRVHLGETYRLHRRVLRTRRDSPIAIGFPVRGRQQAEVSVVIPPGLDNLIAWTEDWFDLVSGRMVNGTLRPDEGRLLTGLFDRMYLDPVVSTAFIDSWLDGTNEECAYLSDVECISIDHWRPSDSEERLLRDLRDIIGAHSSEDWARSVCEQVLEMPFGTVVFTGYPCATESLYASLVGHCGSGEVGIYNDPRQERDTKYLEKFVTGKLRYIVCGPVAEEGRNMQCASAMFHAHLPWNPNRLEQRIGRIDRFGMGGEVPSRVAIAPDSLNDHWYRFLRDGFGVFGSSIAALQHVIDGATVRAIDDLVALGPESWVDSASRLSEELRQERLEIMQLENLESIEDESPLTRTLFNDLQEVESNERTIQKSIEDWLCGSPGSGGGLGLRLNAELEQADIRSYNFERGGDLAIPKEVLIEYIGGHLGKRCTAFRQTAANETSDLQFLRPGGAFFEGIRNLTESDALGQSFGYWRRAPYDDPRLVLVVNYRIEAMAGPAMSILRDRGHHVPHATLQRVLDGFFAPITLRVLLDETGLPVDDAVLARVAVPFNRRSDVPIASGYIQDIEESLDITWSEMWDRVGSLALGLATKEARLVERQADALEMSERHWEDSLSKSDLRLKTESSDHHRRQLKSDVVQTEEMQTAVRLSILGVTPIPESVGIVMLSRDRPEELWGHRG